MATLNIKLLPKQQEILTHPARFKICATGRRFGKSRAAAYKIIIEALQKDNGVYFLVSPSYSQTKIIWRMIKQFLPKETIKRTMEGELYIELHNGSMIFAKSGDNPDCYDDKTEILTQDGWKLFENLTLDDIIFTLNKENYIGEWHKPKRLIKEWYSGSMYSYKNRKVDLLVTPNHKFFIESGDGIKKFKTLDEVTHHDKIPSSITNYDHIDEDISLDKCAILGFFLAEGSAYGCCGGDISKRRGNYEIVFAQTPGNKGGEKGNVREKFKEILIREGYNPHERKDALIVLNKKLWEEFIQYGNKYTKYIPKKYKNLPKEKLRMLLHWLVMGDGCIRRNHEEVYYTTSKQLADDVQEIGIKCGYFPTIRTKTQNPTIFDNKTRPCNNFKTLYCVSINRTKYNYFAKTGQNYVSTVQYSGFIHCVEVENNVILVRRNNFPCWSGNSLRGEGLDGVVLDECAMLRAEVWNEAIRPALSDKNGWAMMISSPKGKNWFYELFLRGLDETQNEFKSFQYPSWANPLLKPTEIEEMRKSMPEISFRQEVMAEFLDSGGAVFRGLDQVLTSLPEDPIPGEFYMIGVDLGRHEDFTIIKVGKLSEHREVYRERFNQSDWDYIKERIRTIYNKYNKGCVIMDSTGYGDPIYEDLSKEGLNINGINMNVSTKPMLIENLQLMIENKQISLINDPNLTLEFGAYTYTILPSGNVRYEAAKGFHDDEVVSTALMAIGMQGGGTQAVGVVEPFDEEKYGERVADYDDLPEVIEWDELEEYEKTKHGR